MTVRGYLASSLRLLGVLAPGEPLQEQDYTDALQSFSDMLDAWSLKRLTIYGQRRDELALADGTQRYSIGTGGAWNIPRPTWIDRASFLTTDGIESNIDVYPEDQWAEIGLKSATGPLPAGIYYNPTFPLGAVDVWPVPTDATVKIVLYGPAAVLTSVASLDTVISAPPGWAKALRYNLAVELGPMYPGMLAQEVADVARLALAAIKRPNSSKNEMRLDPALVTPRGRFSIDTGEYLY